MRQKAPKNDNFSYILWIPHQVRNDKSRTTNHELEIKNNFLKNRGFYLQYGWLFVKYATNQGWFVEYRTQNTENSMNWGKNEF